MSQEAQDTPFRSVHTNTLSQILRECGISLAISTYQAGMVVIVRPDGDLTNTHFRTMPEPMGMVLHNGRFVIGTRLGYTEYHNQPAVSQRLDETGRTDAVYMPRYRHTSGDIAVHEIDIDHQGELWAVNTRFSCLCTFDRAHSFVPRWRPPFITGYSPDDRCHLNGMGFVDGQPKYVTALGDTDVGGAWRDNKARGGVLMEVPSGEKLLTGLSMPHSPRWYQGQLYYCESGVGTLNRLNLSTGKSEVIAEVPGFTRGLDFFGPLAFIGLSQVRETAVFSGIPITERLTAEERCCGMWVVDLRNGQVVAFLRFEAGVQEVFGVTIMPHRWPDLVNDESSDVVKQSYVLPDEALKEVSPSGAEKRTQRT
ncbi:MAG: TIGR03032 family protein [Fimbriiglobus sp.]